MVTLMSDEGKVQQRPPRIPPMGTAPARDGVWRFWSTKFNELTHAKKILAKKDGAKVIVDLNSIDDYYDSLPEVGDEAA